jgi:hypothetical protein
LLELLRLEFRELDSTEHVLLVDGDDDGDVVAVAVTESIFILILMLILVLAQYFMFFSLWNGLIVLVNVLCMSILGNNIQT